MFKQIYRFLSILIVSNLLFTPAAFSKTPKNVKEPASSTKNTCLEELEKLSKETANKKPKPIKEEDQKPYVTKYGVFFPDDIEDTYPQPQNNNKPEPAKPPCDNKPVVKPKPVTQKPDENTYVTKYGVYFPDDVFDTYSQQQNDCPPADKSN